MVASASSSKTKWPSGRWCAMRARVAASMRSSKDRSLEDGSRKAGSPEAGLSLIAAAVELSGMEILGSSLRRELGGAISGADGALNRRGQAGIGPIPGQEQIAPFVPRPRPAGILRVRRREGGAPLPHNLPWRQAVRKAGRDLDLVPDRARQRLARRVEEPVAGADGDRQPARKCKDPFRRRVEDAEDRRLAGRRIEAEMGVDDGAELRGRREVWHDRGRRIGRDREN